MPKLRKSTAPRQRQVPAAQAQVSWRAYRIAGKKQTLYGSFLGPADYKAARETAIRKYAADKPKSEQDRVALLRDDS